MKILYGVVIALGLICSCAMSQTDISSARRDGRLWLAFSATDKQIYIMGFMDGHGISPKRISVAQFKDELDTFYSQPDSQYTLIAEAITVILNEKSKYR